MSAAAGPRTLSVRLAGATLPTPVMVASGCAGTGAELPALMDVRHLGGLVSRTVTVEPRVAGPMPRIAESPSGLVWTTGLQNPGIAAFLEEELPRLAATGVPVFVSIGGGRLDEYVRLASLLRAHREVAALEVFLSGPDEELGGEAIGAHPERAGEIVGAVARMATVPVFAKLPPVAPDPVAVAEACVRAGADGIVVCGLVPAMAVDRSGGAGGAGRVIGWLAGPAVAPIVLRMVGEIALALPSVPVIASGGIRTGEDAVEAMLAGASAVQVGTAALVEPSTPVDVAKGIAGSLRDRGLTGPAELVGAFRTQARGTRGESS